VPAMDMRGDWILSTRMDVAARDPEQYSSEWHAGLQHQAADHRRTRREVNESTQEDARKVAWMHEQISASNPSSPASRLITDHQHQLQSVAALRWSPSDAGKIIRKSPPKPPEECVVPAPEMWNIAARRSYSPTKQLPEMQIPDVAHRDNKDLYNSEGGAGHEWLCADHRRTRRDVRSVAETPSPSGWQLNKAASISPASPASPTFKNSSLAVTQHHHSLQSSAALRWCPTEEGRAPAPRSYTNHREGLLSQELLAAADDAARLQLDHQQKRSPLSI